MNKQIEAVLLQLPYYLEITHKIKVLKEENNTLKKSIKQMNRLRSKKSN